MQGRPTGGLARVSGCRFRPSRAGNRSIMVGILIAAVLAALTFAVCMALGLPAVVGIVFAVLVLGASLPKLGSRFGIRDY
jgi:4-hydroxybenzoate polyprenyltransferase